LFNFFAIIIVPLATTMIIEKYTGRNLFSVFGGVPEVTMVRPEHEGATFLTRIRCQGPFRHPILAGTFGAVLMPFFMSLWFNRGISKVMAIIGIVSASIITVAAASSGPILAYICVVGGFLIWPLRRNMRLVRWSIVSVLIGLQLFMKDPIWYIFAHISGVMGGTGWHRSALIHQAITHFREWWLVGTTYTRHWLATGVSSDPNMTDITNQYIWEGVSGGIVKLILFVTIIVMSYKSVGLSLHAMENEPFPKKIIIWATGISLTAHVVTFLSVVYFDQMIVFWYMILAMIAALPAKAEESSMCEKSIPEPVSLSTR
jgi:hypothetical protein